MPPSHLQAEVSRPYKPDDSPRNQRQPPVRSESHFGQQGGRAAAGCPDPGEIDLEA
jgi:hypothetical protein